VRLRRYPTPGSRSAGAISPTNSSSSGGRGRPSRYTRFLRVPR